MNPRSLLSGLAIAALLSALNIHEAKAAPPPKTDNAAGAETTRLREMIVRFAPTELTADLSKFSPNDKRVLAKLVAASQIIDGIFLRQVWAGNVSLMLALSRDQTPEGLARFHYFRLNKGPWSRLDDDKPFVVHAPPKPE